MVVAVVRRITAIPILKERAASLHERAAVGQGKRWTRFATHLIKFNGAQKILQIDIKLAF